jgi:hypothetical protein
LTLAELLLLIAGGAGVYGLLRPFQRWLQRALTRAFFARHSHSQPTIDVTDFTSYQSRRRDNDE